MAIVALVSASGSPGVTTTALGLALLWPRPVMLVEADPTGGSGLLAGYFRCTREYDSGLIELALTASNLSDALADVARDAGASDLWRTAQPPSARSQVRRASRASAACAAARLSSTG